MRCRPCARKKATDLGRVTGLIHAARVSPVGGVTVDDPQGRPLRNSSHAGRVRQRHRPRWGGRVIASQSGHRLPPLTVEQNIALATTPAEELLDLPFLHIYQVTAITRREVPRPELGFKSAAAPPRESLPHVPHLFPMY